MRLAVVRHSRNVESIVTEPLAHLLKMNSNFLLHFRKQFLFQHTRFGKLIIQ